MNIYIVLVLVQLQCPKPIYTYTDILLFRRLGGGEGERRGKLKGWEGVDGLGVWGCLYRCALSCHD